MKKIPLTQGKFALVDDEDYGWLMQWRWCAAKRRNTYYANKHKSDMHREILGLKHGDGKFVDHKDRNGLNNQKSNLRITTRSINALNCKVHSTNTSGYRGVSWFKGKWQVQIVVKGRRVHCGYYKNKVVAAKVYDKEAIAFRGAHAKLNFPLKRRTWCTT
jgi:hypothetical protein